MKKLLLFLLLLCGTTFASTHTDTIIVRYVVTYSIETENLSHETQTIKKDTQTPSKMRVTGAVVGFVVIFIIAYVAIGIALSNQLKNKKKS